MFARRLTAEERQELRGLGEAGRKRREFDR